MPMYDASLAYCAMALCVSGTMSCNANKRSSNVAIAVCMDSLILPWLQSVLLVVAKWLLAVAKGLKRQTIVTGKCYANQADADSDSNAIWGTTTNPDCTDHGTANNNTNVFVSQRSAP